MRCWRQAAARGLQREVCCFPAWRWDLPPLLSTVLGFFLLERQLVAHSSRSGFSAVVCEKLVLGVGLRTTQHSSGSPSSITKKVLCSARGSCALRRVISSRCCVSFYSFSATGRCVCLLHHTHKTGENVRANDTGAVVHCPRLSPPTAWVRDLLRSGVGRRSNRLCCKPAPSWAHGGRARKKEKTNMFRLQANNNQPKGKSEITQRLFLYECRSHSSLLVGVVPHLWPVSSVDLLYGIFLTCPQPLSATGTSQAKAGTLVWGPCTQRSWGQMHLWKGFFNKNNWKVGDGVSRQVFNPPTPQPLEEIKWK